MAVSSGARGRRAWRLLAGSLTTGRRVRRSVVSLIGALALLIAVPATAHADPPPAYDYDTDGCYPTPAIGRNGVIAPGLPKGGAKNGHCRDSWDLDNTNGYARYKCNNGWCAIIYGLYFEKDQAASGPGADGHTHDWEHVVVWVQNNQAKYVSASRHGGFDKRPANQVRWDGTHPKIVYHQDGQSTHAFRFASNNDEPPENHYHGWQFPRLVGWNGYPAGLRDKLSNANFGKATFGLKDSTFNNHLASAKPDNIPFDPWKCC